MYINLGKTREHICKSIINQCLIAAEGEQRPIRGKTYEYSFVEMRRIEIDNKSRTNSISFRRRFRHRRKHQISTVPANGNRFKRESITLSARVAPLLSYQWRSFSFSFFLFFFLPNWNRANAEEASEHREQLDRSISRSQTLASSRLGKMYNENHRSLVTL